MLDCRYEKSINNFTIAMSIADNINIYDHSLDGYQLLYAYEKGFIIEKTDIDKLSEKIKKIIEDFKQSHDLPDPEKVM